MLVNDNISDENECEADKYDCPPSSICINEIGSYTCMCINNTRKDEQEHCIGMPLLCTRSVLEKYTILHNHNIVCHQYVFTCYYSNTLFLSLSHSLNT